MPHVSQPRRQAVACAAIAAIRAASSWVDPPGIIGRRTAAIATMATP